MMKRTRHRWMDTEPVKEVLEWTQAHSRRLKSPADLDPLMGLIGDAQFVLLGEASHGTADFYEWRAALTRRLIVEKGFSFVAVEGDWPDCYRLHQYVTGRGDSQSAREVLCTFQRWPTWMWANAEVACFAEWMRHHNENCPAQSKVGFFGLDVYSLWESLYAIIAYLRRSDPSLLESAWRAFRCFEPYGEDAQEYARATRFVPQSCEDEVVQLLEDLREHSLEVPPDRSLAAWEAAFAAEQNALVVKNAESYYRAMVRGGPDSWNIRDRHMVETLERLLQHRGPRSKAIVWAHNTHIGDARYTDMAELAEVNVGQLVRQRHHREGVVLIGFGSYQGTVIAGRHWEAPMQRLRVPPAREGSWEDVMHSISDENKLLLLSVSQPPAEVFVPRGHRAIGVVYRPEHDRIGNYVPTILPLRYDAFLYFDRTEALHPLSDVDLHDEGEVPETYPSGV